MLRCLTRTSGMQAGYRLHDRVLRPAEVGVVQADTQSAAAE